MIVSQCLTQLTWRRTSLQLAEQERRGGIANRVSPMISETLQMSPIVHFTDVYILQALQMLPLF